MLDLFLRAADELVALGVDGITTSCGFLAILHPQLVAHCPVPMATSSLLQIPLVQSILPKGKRVGVLTADKDALSPDHFRAVGCPTDLPVVGMPPDGIFRYNNRTGQPVVDHAAQEREVLGMAETAAAGKSRSRRHRQRMHQPAALLGEDRSRHSAFRSTTSSASSSGSMPG